MEVKPRPDIRALLTFVQASSLEKDLILREEDLDLHQIIVLQVKRMGSCPCLVKHFPQLLLQIHYILRFILL